MLCWVLKWLDSRAQRVVVNRTITGWQLVTSSIPQGSILGPDMTFLSTIWMQDCNVSAARLLVVINWQVLLTPWKEERPCKGSTGQLSVANNSTKEIARCCTWDRVRPNMGRDWETSGCRAAQQEGIWRCWSATGST